MQSLGARSIRPTPGVPEKTDDTGNPGRHKRPGTGGPRSIPADAEMPKLTRLREMQLVDAHRAGEPEAIGKLLRAYQRRIYAVCYRMLRNADEAADLTQDSLVKVIEGIDSYDGRAALSTWVIRVTMNCCLSHLRKQKIRRHRSLDSPVGPDDQPAAAILQGSEEPSSLERVEQAEARSVLLGCLGDLDPEMRSVIVLRDMQDLDYQQIGEVLQVPIGTVKSRLFRARAALRAAAEIRMKNSRRNEADR